MLEVQDLYVSVDKKELLKGVKLVVEEGEVAAIMGHNASGKTTLALTLAGFPQYSITKGRIIFRGEDITYKAIHERAKAGLAIAFQSPPAIRGIKLGDMIALAGGINPWTSNLDIRFVEEVLRKVNLEPSLYMDRELNVGFSGGERKRSELAQIFAMRPKLIILDEIDSGVDIDSLRILGGSLREYIDLNRCSAIVITHHRHILQYLKPNRVHIMSNGKIVLSGTYEELVPKIETLGYEALIKGVSTNG
ncbi:MAG: Fe-S cluster assembly ATPase SufC [Candidatus Methanomethyliaceae archaeon]|nr:Fe-S cluster assembly ATPase SufC [Candidatus Methanomethyliaceae archaeon]